MQNTQIITDDTLMELTPHGTDQFPFQYYYDDILKYDTGNISWHWHKEFEFCTVERGTVDCMIGNTKILLREGEGMFINSGIIHSFETSDHGIMPNILFLPEFLSAEGSRIYEKFIHPFLDTEVSHIVFSDNVIWQNEVISILYEIYQLFKNKSETMELEIHTLACRMWTTLFLHKEDIISVPKSGVSMLSQARLKQMIRFMEERYSDKLTLADIALSANISKSEALRCFKTGMQTSPIDYLNKYRLHKAKKLLLNTKTTISSIAEQVGFESTSYFDRVFKKEYHMTPKVFRSN